MKIYFNQLAKDLTQNLRPVYLLTGDEPLQLMEAGDMICHAARQAGFSEKQIYHVERGFDWGELYQAANSMSLFDEKKIIDLRLTSCKPGDKGSKAIMEYCDSLSDCNILIIRMPRLEKAVQKSKWYATLEKIAGIVQIWPIDIDKLPGWIAQRAKAQGITLSPPAIKWLTENVEGNLLAAAQEIEKLALSEKKQIDVDDLIESVDDSARFDVFKLTEAVLAGQSARAVKIVLGLKASGEEPILVLWALSNEIRTLIRISSKRAAGQSLPAIFKAERVWDSRQALMTSALQRLRGKMLSAALREAMLADKMVKGIVKGNVWDKLLDISISMSGKMKIEGL